MRLRVFARHIKKFKNYIRRFEIHKGNAASRKMRYLEYESAHVCRTKCDEPCLSKSRVILKFLSFSQIWVHVLRALTVQRTRV